MGGHRHGDPSGMLAHAFHAWERRLASVTRDRVTRPFDWGLDWIGADGRATGRDPASVLIEWSDAAMADSDRFYACAPPADYRLVSDELTFSSAAVTPHPENNLVRARYFRAPRAGGRAVLVLPQWNADPDGHVALCRLIARAGHSALRLSLPYHDRRMPPELHRADYIVSANVGRTAQVCRQAVLDARGAVEWLARRGYDRIGILGTSLGSCLAMLTAAHEPRIRAAALNHISPYFADVVWEGLSTAHVREGLEGHIELDVLRRCWLPISPQPFLTRLGNRRTLLVYARYDLTFPVALSRRLAADFHALGLPHEIVVLPCGHYSTARFPFSWLDAYYLVSFLRRNL
jgi:dienelactone hydrolase